MHSNPNTKRYSDLRSTPVSTPDLGAALAGSVITPDDPEYEASRQVRNAAFDRRPALIVRAATAGDVSLAVSFARENGLELAVRGGAHSFAGHGTSDGGLVLDLSQMRALHVDPEGQTAWAQAGLTSGEYTVQTARHGLTTGFGDTGSVGIAGITLGGGISWLVRKHGLTIDDLLAVELVTADGELLHVNAQRHPDLFWALRGGGGNFGVATRLRYRLHEIDTILGGVLILPATPAIVRSFISAADEAPEELSTNARLAAAPPLPFVPSEHHGRLVLIVTVVYAGDVEAGQRAVADLRRLATPIVDAVRPMPYQEMYARPEAPGRLAVALRSTFHDRIDEQAAETILDRMRTAPSPMTGIEIRVLGGAMARVPADATAFAHRERRRMVTIAAAYQNPDESAHHQAWVADSLAALRPDASGVHVSFLGDESDARIREAYPEPAHRRLAAIKRRYDPTNLFKLNQNIALNS